MAKGPSPLVGYNTNVRHKGKLYHIQTEDSGVQHPHVITHLFVDGGRILASKKTSYGDYVGREDLLDVVKKLMREQHKAMFIALRDGVYDDPEPAATKPKVEAADLDRAAAQLAPTGALAVAPKEEAPKSEVAPRRFSSMPSGKYQSTQPVQSFKEEKPISKPPSIFGGQFLSEKSLDEVILSYLAEDLEGKG